MQTGQDKIRQNYKDIRDNLDVAAEKKAMQKLKQHDLVKQHGTLIEKHKGLIDEYGKLSGENKQLKQKVSDLTFQNRSYQNENRDLMSENGKLKEKLEQISKEFSAFKERVSEVLHNQIDRFKTFLRIRDVDPSHIKALDERQDKLVQDSLQKLEKPQREKEMEMEL